MDSAGDVYIGDIANDRVQKFDPEGNFVLMFGGDVNKTAVEEGGTTQERNLCTAASGDVCGAGVAGEGEGQFDTNRLGDYIAISPEDTVWVGDNGRIQEFNPDGTFKGQIVFEGEVAGKDVQSLASDRTDGSLYAIFAGLQEQIFKLQEGEFLGGAFPLQMPEGKAASALEVDSEGNLYAVVEASVANDPEVEEEAPVAQVRHEVLGFDAEGAPLAGRGVGDRFAASPPTPKVSEWIGLVGLGANPAPGPCALEEPNIYTTSYNGLVASYLSAYGSPPTDTKTNPEACEPPPIAPEVAAQYASSVGAEEASLGAQINPSFWVDTAYHLQYGEAGCPASGWSEGCASTPARLLSEKALDSPVPTRAFLLSGLEPETTYHYRFIAQSGGGGPTVGEERTFTTYPLPGAPRTDCPNQPHRSGPGALLVECRAYELVSPVDKGGGDVVVQRSFGGSPAALDQSSAEGEKLTYSSKTSFGEALGAPYSSQYIAAREAGREWSTRSISPPRGEKLLHDSANVKFDTEFRAFGPDLCDAWLVPNAGPALGEGVPGRLNLYRRGNCGPGAGGFEAITTEAPAEAGNPYWPELQGRSADGSHVVFRANGRLAVDSGPEAASGSAYQLYERVGGSTRLVSVLPGGAANPGGSSAGTANANEAEGEGRINSVATAVSADASRIYWTAAEIGPGPLYLRIDGAQTRTVSANPARFHAASADGSVALYSTGERLRAYDAGADKSIVIADGVLGVAGASEDATRVYLASTEALTEEPNSEGEVASEGQPNLYLYDAEAEEPFAFVAPLSARDTQNGYAAIDPWPVTRPARVSPDGAHLAFMSNAPLTGYDSTDTASGQRATQVFLYDAESGELNCASCNPSGARPQVRAYPAEKLLTGHVAPARTIAAQIPAWANQLHAPRALTEDGSRLYFESFDPLVLRDTNGRQDVYEWRESSGRSECEAIGADLWAEASGGCLSLISSGESPQGSSFVDASRGGRDVFFKTAESLLPQDPGLIDIYDARRGGGLPVPTGPEPGCQGEACQPATDPPAPPSPASLAFRGPGNEPPPSPCSRRARQAKRLSTQAKRMRRSARGAARRFKRGGNAAAARRARRLRRGADRRAKRAKRTARAARRCRARQRSAGGGEAG